MAQDQLEIINAQGEVRFHNLNSGRGITNIGRHPDNDIVINSDVVAPFHAILDHQQRPYRLVALNADGQVKVSGQLLQPNVPRELRNWDTIELDGTSIILMEGGAASGSQAPTIIPTPLPTPTPPLPAAIPLVPLAAASTAAIAPAINLNSLDEMDELDRLLAMLPEDQVDESIIVEPLALTGELDPTHPNALDFSVDVEQPATMQIGITNGGDLVGEFMVEVRGIDPTWVSISPASINLFEGQKGNVSIAITAPRLASSTAKAHYFSVVVSSPTYPGRYSSTAGVLIIKPFYDYAVGDIDPKKQKIAWSKKVGMASLPITNLGNAPLPVQVSGEDERHAATLEFDSPEEHIRVVNQVQLHIPSQEIQRVKVYITPRKRRVIGIGGENLQYTLTVTPMAGTEQTPRSVLGQANALPFMGPLPIILLLFLLGLLVVFFLTPRIEEYEVDRALIAAGESSTLSWRTSAFTTVKIDPGDGEPVDSPIGSLTVSPTEDTTYTMTATTILTALLPQWFTATRSLSIDVEPVLPVIRVFETTGGEEVISGETVTVSWDVGNADNLILSINGADDTIADDQHTGTRTFRVERDTIFTLRAFNPYTPAEGLTQSITVRAVVPSATPPPQPLIRQFEVTPLDIVFGQDVTITWAVDGATSVTISGVEGQLPPEGSVTVRPDSDTGYVLTATNGVTEITSQVQQVLVRPPSTPTPAPNAPQIDTFAAQPAQVGIDSPESKNVQLSWIVNGDTTDIEIIGPSGLRYNGLPKQGSLRVVVDKASLYVLTAYNGESLFSSSTTQVKVVNPVPKIDSITPNSSTDVGGTGTNIKVIGSGFTKESKVQWAGSNRSTAYVSPTELTATILAEDFIVAGTFEVKVFNPTPGGGTSGAAAFTLNNPSPVLDSISPGEAFFGTTDTTLNVFGTSFVKNSVVRFGGVDLTTTYVSSTQLSARIPSSQLDSAGAKQILVFNPSPGGGTSTIENFNVFSELLTPSITSISPIETSAGSGSFPLTITGGNFSTGSRIQWKGINLATQFISSSELRATLDSSLLQAVGVAKVTVANPPPDGAETVLSQVTSNAKAFTIKAVSINFVEFSTPTDVETIHPVVQNDPILSNGYVTLRLSSPLNSATTIELSTSNTSRLVIHEQDECTNPGSATFVLVPAGETLVQLCVRGLNTALPQPVITARLPTILGGGQTSLTVPVNSTAPTINELQPNSIGLDAPSFTMTIVGTSFGNDISRVRVKWPGRGDLTPNSINGNQLQVSIPETYMNTSGVVNISVEVNGATSNTLPFTVGPPQLNSIDVTTRVAGSQGFELDLSGTDFVRNARVALWRDSDCDPVPPASGTATLYTPSSITRTSISVDIPASETAVEGTICVSVVTPAGAYTDAETITVTPFNTTLNLPSSVTMGGVVRIAQLNFATSQYVSRTIGLTDNPSTGLNFINAINSTTCGSDPITSVAANPPAIGGISTVYFCVQAEGVSSALPATSSSVEVTADVQGVVENTNSLPATDTMNVNRASVSLSVVPSPASGSAQIGQEVTFTVTLTPTGTLTPTVSNSITIRNGATTLCTIASVSSGIGSCSVVMTAAGTLSLTANYTGDSNFGPASTSFSYEVIKATTDVQVDVGTPANTSVYGQTVTFSARVSASPNAGNLNGVVTFYADGGATEIASVNVSGAPGTSFLGTLSYSDALTNDPNAGTHTITATYTDSSGLYENDTSNTGITHIITKAPTTTTAGAVTATYSTVNQNVTLTATVTSSTVTVNAGTVTFTIKDNESGADPTCSGTVSGGSASSTCNLLGGTDAGSYSVEAVYCPTDTCTNFSTSSDVDAAAELTVNRANTTTTANTATATYSSSDQTVILIANVTVSSGIVDEGSVTFTVKTTGGTTIGSATTDSSLVSGAAAVNYTLPAGTSAGSYTVEAVYNPAASNPNFNTSSDVDAATELTINRANTATIANNVVATYSSSNQTLTLAAAVSGGSNTVNEGTVTFTVKTTGGTTVGSAVTSGTLVSGAASASYTLPGGTAAGNYNIEAVFNQSTNFNTSSDVDAGTELLVNQAATTISTANIGTDKTTPNCSGVANTICFRVSSVSVTGPSTGTPTGTVFFRVYTNVTTPASCGPEDTTLSHTSANTTINNWSAATPALTPGNYCVTATYNGDTNFSASPESARVAFAIP